MTPTPEDRRTADPASGTPPSEPDEASAEPERRRISDYLGDVSRLEAELAVERKQNEELRTEVAYQRRRIEREEEARLQLMQLLDNSQRLLGNAQRHTQHLLGGNEAEIFTMALPVGQDAPDEQAPPSGESPQAEAAPPPAAKPRRRWWSLG